MLAWVAEWGRAILGFVQVHQAWGGPVCFLLAFGESLAIVSFFLPATLVLVGLGALAGQAGLPLLPLLVGAALGAALGDWVSFWVGRQFDERITGLWPLSSHPDLLVRARAFVERWGAPGVFLGRFLGPLRATVPLVAGLCAMRSLPFQIANCSSAVVWAVLVLTPGAFGIEALRGWLA